MIEPMKDQRFQFDSGRGIISYRSGDGIKWEASRFGYNGGYKGSPIEHYVDATVGVGGYMTDEHEIELTRADLLAMLAMIDQAQKWSAND